MKYNYRDHWFFQKYKDRIEVIDEDVFYHIISANNIKVSRNRRLFFDWECCLNTFVFSYYVVDLELQITAWLGNSILSAKNSIIVNLSPRLPKIRVATEFFISNWSEFESINGEGVSVVSQDGELFMEFTNEGNRYLRSNFEIKPGSKEIKITN